MPKIIYPFAAIPNQILRSGHGGNNIAVLATLMSHGRSTASAKTIADEVGCDRKTVFKAINYWKEQGEKYGIFIRTKEQIGQPTVIEIEITTCTENGTGAVETRTENGTQPVPKTVHLPVPKTVHKEEPIKKIKEEDNTPLPPTGGIVAQPQGGIDQSYFDNPRSEIKIIGLYAQTKQCVFENIEQAQSFVRRNLLPARNLKGYRYERIHEVMNYLVNNANFKWTLETVAKYIDEDLERNNKNSIPTIQIEKLIRVEEL